ncbi:MAG: zinc ABC transporter substrate-binding protein [Waddliaceae bacterium]
MSRLFLLFSILFLPLMGVETNKPRVLVSVPPHKFFVEQITKDTLDVEVLIPPGSNAHTFEPSPRDINKMVGADIWFRVGEGFEDQLIKTLTSYQPDLEIIDLRDGLDLIPVKAEHHAYCSHGNCYDPHIWLSPKLAKQQAERITKSLVALYPYQKHEYEKNLARFKNELDKLNEEIEKKFRPLVNRTILVSHPAYAYFARDYNLKQIPIEHEGKEPTPQQLTQLLDRARQSGAKRVFVQQQYRGKGPELIAQQIGAEVVVLNPLSEDFIDNLREIARQFAGEKES